MNISNCLYIKNKSVYCIDPSYSASLDRHKKTIHPLLLYGWYIMIVYVNILTREHILHLASTSLAFFRQVSCSFLRFLLTWNPMLMGFNCYLCHWMFFLRFMWPFKRLTYWKRQEFLKKLQRFYEKFVILFFLSVIWYVVVISTCMFSSGPSSKTILKKLAPNYPPDC